MDDRADIELVRAVARDDLGAFDPLYDRFARPLYSLGLRWLRQPADAEELVSETFMRMWRSADRFDPDRGTVGSWLFGIARHVATDRLRRNAPSQPLDETFEVAVEADTDRLIDAIDVRGALSRLPLEQRSVLVLAYMEDRTEAQIALRLSIPIGTVKSRRFYGLRALAGFLTPEVAAFEPDVVRAHAATRR